MDKKQRDNKNKDLNITRLREEGNMICARTISQISNEVDNIHKQD